jgi:hypothetical protein
MTKNRDDLDMSSIAMYGAPPVAPPDLDGDIRRLSPDNIVGTVVEVIGQVGELTECKIRLGPDMVNHPPHYTGHPSGIEQIEVSRHMSFCLGSAWKYLFRRDGKGAPLQDLEKSIWYCRDHTKHRRLDEAKILTHDSPHTEAFFWEHCAPEFREPVQKAHRIVSYEPNKNIAVALAFVARAAFVDEDNYTEAHDIARAIAAIELEISQRKAEA